MQKISKYLMLIGLLIVGMYACSDYNKILKGNDYELKYKTAIELYQKDECMKALPLLDELTSMYRFTSKGEEVFYYYAHTSFCVGDFSVAEYYFKSFVKSYPNSKHTEECAFMAAICKQRESPYYNLDPTPTRQAIDEMQLFLNKYPESSYKDTCNLLMDKMRDKLEKKYYEQAKLYYNTENYKSAVVAFENLVRDYPDNEYVEEAYYYMVKANYWYAYYSVDSKKSERYSETIKSYLTFVGSFKESKYLKEVENLYNNSVKQLEKLNN
ncbi:MAG: outer membrane protein assembly factor BamD [Bacteroidia bacterium]